MFVYERYSLIKKITRLNKSVCMGLNLNTFAQLLIGPVITRFVMHFVS